MDAASENLLPEENEDREESDEDTGESDEDENQSVSHNADDDIFECNSNDMVEIEDEPNDF